MRHSSCSFSFGEAHPNEPQAILPGGLKGNSIFLRGISFNMSLDLKNNWVLRILVSFSKDFVVL